MLTRPVKPIPVDRDKVGRLYIHGAKFEAGLVLFVREHRSCLSLNRSY